MGLEGWFTVAVLAVMLVLLALDRLPPSLVVLGATVTFMITGVITREEAFAGFANPAPITVAALYVLAFAAQKTGLLAPAVTKLLGDGRGWRAIARLTVPVAGASAFVNNTPLVAMLIPDVVSWAQRKKVSASKFLMPVSYAAILGGVITLIGTSTNLVVSGLMEEATGEPFSLFEITPIGLPVALVGLAVMIALMGRWSRRGAASTRRRTFASSRSRWRWSAAVRWRAFRSPTAGYATSTPCSSSRSSGTAGSSPRWRPKSCSRPTTAWCSPARSTRSSTCSGRRVSAPPSTRTTWRSTAPGHTFYEAVVGRASPLVGQTLKEADFRSRFQAAVVAIHRARREGERQAGRGRAASRRHPAGAGRARLQAGLG